MQAQKLKVLRAAVKDVDQALATFQKNFGFALTRRTAGGDAQSAFLRIGGAEIELAQAKTGLAAETVAERGEGLFEIELEVADLEAARRHLEAAGIGATREAGDAARLRVDIAHTNGTPVVLRAPAR